MRWRDDAQGAEIQVVDVRDTSRGKQLDDGNWQGEELKKNKRDEGEQGVIDKESISSISPKVRRHCGGSVSPKVRRVCGGSISSRLVFEKEFVNGPKDQKQEC
jgi:hypothetical protein